MATLNVKSLPDPLYRLLRERAKRRHRSVSQEVTSILEEVLLRDAEPGHSLLDLQGLGKEIWEGIDAAEYVDDERRSWD